MLHYLFFQLQNFRFPNQTQDLQFLLFKNKDKRGIAHIRALCQLSLVFISTVWFFSHFDLGYFAASNQFKLDLFLFVLGKIYCISSSFHLVQNLPDIFITVEFHFGEHTGGHSSPSLDTPLNHGRRVVVENRSQNHSSTNCVHFLPRLYFD